MLGHHASIGAAALAFACALLARERAALAIVGGTDDPGDPAVVAVVNDALGAAYCTGALVAPRVVLTAGHCLDVVASAVAFGQDAAKGEHVPVAAYATHPRYSGEGKDFDLAVLVLDHDVTTTPLPTSHAALDASFVGTNVRHVGFGVTSETSASGLGQKRTVTYAITDVDATKLYSGAAAANTCDGDSGGPVLAVLASEGAGERVVGVVSDGPDCHSTGWDDRVDPADVAGWLDPIVADDGAALLASAGPGASAGDDAGAGADGGATAPAASPSSSSGCATAPGSATSPGLLVLLIAAALLYARRREPHDHDPRLRPRARRRRVRRG